MAYFWRLFEMSATMDDLGAVLTEATTTLGFQRYALTHHVDLMHAGGRVMRLHNYPAQWADFYDRHGIGLSDPVHRASHVTASGFAWREIPAMIPLNLQDHKILELGRQQGIGDGYTVPINVPGEANGSVTFVNGTGIPLHEPSLPLAQLFGIWAFEKARRLSSGRGTGGAGAPILTMRQREFTALAALGKTDGEIADLTGVTKQTAGLHLRNACECYGVSKRTLLVVRALFDGTITLTQIFRR
ncbi:MAG: LuxR family transcriptional regulator [Novosphingobium pentaromativorans]|jgi:LuxR family quorum-sensing system transcriptional regulator CciR|uniref:LuxR family transcriptional regulator n=1 Tax=Novosphingobium pentaromativorans TaxID=205844 RepID=A0A2W5NBS7_9SPHN|nr:MAG: LuxR family transcriptional regulator [Novosphingobium pentaromativorans]